MNLKLHITLRYFRSKKRNIFISVLTFISILGVLIAVASLICVNSVVRGFEMEIKEKILQNEPHILILPNSSNVKDKDFYDLIGSIKGDKDIEVITPYVSSTVLISSFNNLNVVKLNGIEPKMAKKAYGIFRNLKYGKLSYIDNSNQAYYDHKKLEQKLYIGQKIKNLKNSKIVSEKELFDLGANPQKDGKYYMTQKDYDELKREIEYLKKDSYIAPPKNRKCVFIGKALSESLLLKTGETLKLITPFGDIGPTGLMPKSRKFRICGVFFTSLYEFDQYNIYTPIKNAKKFLGISRISGIEIKIDNIYDSERVVKKLKKFINKDKFKITGFSKMNKNLFSALKTEKFGMFVLFILVMLVASFNIIATLTLIVNSKKKEISILKSLGMPNRGIRDIFMLKGVIIGFVGITIGTILGLLIAKLLSSYKMNEQVYYIPNLPVRIETVEIIGIVIATFIVTLLAAIIPAYRASKVPPVYGLKGE